MKPLISVVIPVYNTEKYITEAVKSVFRQSYENTEIIIVDDGSTDATLNTLKEFGEKIKIISQENKGQSVARNVGIKNARGPIIGLLDADDVWPDDHITLMLSYLDQDSSYDFVRGMVEYVKDLGTNFEQMTEPIFLESLVGACLYKRSIFDKVGLFDEEMRQGEDFDWNIRLLENDCKEKKIDQLALLYRRHRDNLTNIEGVLEKGQMDACRKKIARAQVKSIKSK